MNEYQQFENLLYDLFCSSYGLSFGLLVLIGFIFIILKMYKMTLLLYYSIKNHKYNYIAFMSDCEYQDVCEIIDQMPCLVAIHYGSHEYCAVDFNGDSVRGQLGARFNPIIIDDNGNEILVKPNTIGRVNNRPEKTILFKVLKFILRKGEKE